MKKIHESAKRISRKSPSKQSAFLRKYCEKNRFTVVTLANAQELFDLSCFLEYSAIKAAALLEAVSVHYSYMRDTMPKGTVLAQSFNQLDDECFKLAGDLKNKAMGMTTSIHTLVLDAANGRTGFEV